MSKLNRLPVYYLVFFIVMIIVNYAVGSSVGDVANKYETLIQPAGYAFSIWGVIYIALFAWIMRMLLVKNSRDKIQITLQWMPAINFLLNSIWIITFTQEWILVSTLVIFTLWLTILWMYIQISKHNYHWLDRLPLSLYLGWVSLATIVNIFTWFEQIAVTYPAPFDETLIVTLVLGAVAVILVLLTIRSRDWIIPLVALWTYIAIMSNADVSDTAFYFILIMSYVVFVVSALVNSTASKEHYLGYRKRIF